jgi:hypothetical protein
MVSGVSDFFQTSRPSRSEFATRLLPGQDNPAPSVQNQYFLISCAERLKAFKFPRLGLRGLMKFLNWFSCLYPVSESITRRICSDTWRRSATPFKEGVSALHWPIIQRFSDLYNIAPYKAPMLRHHLVRPE